MIKECSTKYFGNYSYDDSSVIVFDNGLFGFEEQKQFLLIQLDQNNENVLCLQSLTDSNIAFFTVNPFAFYEDYNPVPTDKEIAAIGARDMGDVLVYVICAMTDDINTSTANLKCPIMINSHNKKAVQVILDNPEYQFRHSFSALGQKEGGESAC